MKFFRLCLRESEAGSWGNIGAFRCVRMQSMAKIFLAHNHMGGIHNPSITHGGV